MQSVLLWCGQHDPFLIRQNLGDRFLDRTGWQSPGDTCGYGRQSHGASAAECDLENVTLKFYRDRALRVIPFDDETGVQQILDEIPGRATYAAWKVLVSSDSGAVGLQLR